MTKVQLRCDYSAVAGDIAGWSMRPFGGSGVSGSAGRGVGGQGSGGAGGWGGQGQVAGVAGVVGVGTRIPTEPRELNRAETQFLVKPLPPQEPRHPQTPPGVLNPGLHEFKPR
jgi:hypothetical protein